MFRTIFDKKHFYSNPGSPVKIEYGSTIDKNGNIIVKEKGKKDLYGFIQSWTDSVDLPKLVERFTKGDINALQQRESQYLDLTEMPKSYFEVINKLNDSKFEFDALPLETKRKFDSDFNKYLLSVDDGTIYEKLGYVKKGTDVKEQVKEEIKEEKGVETNE